MTASLFEYAERQADLRPEAIAIVLGEDRITYGDLALTSSRLARLLQDGGAEPGDRVCVFMPKSPLAIVAMHGAMKAGCAYVPVDTASPPSRIARIVSASQPRWLLATRSAWPMLGDILSNDPHERPSLGWLEEGSVPEDGPKAMFTLADLSAHPPRPLPVDRSADRPAHILFTSGSTGVPKGVVITHSNAIAFVEWAVAYFGMDSSDRVSGHSPLHFDLSTFDIYGAFAAGAELHQVPPELNILALRLAAFIRSSRLTQWFSVPSALSYMASFDAIEPHDFPELRRLLWCGEVFPAPPLRHWMLRLPHVRFTNLYGPTEATIASSYHTLDSPPALDADGVPIGRPCQGEELLVLDDSLAELPDDQVGDLYIAGAGLSPGYWRDATLTEQAFREFEGRRVYRTGDLAKRGLDGLLYFHGRSDTQIKSRGHRIELGEIEAALATLPELRESAVVAISSTGFEGTTICCAYVVAKPSTMGPRTIRMALARLVPNYMIPSRWLELERLPTNANGKVDKPALRESFGNVA